MSRMKSHTGHERSDSRKSRAPRTGSARRANRPENAEKMRRYLEFVRVVVGGPTRNGK
jgi:hypothetical protein